MEIYRVPMSHRLGRDSSVFPTDQVAMCGTGGGTECPGAESVIGVYADVRVWPAGGVQNTLSEAAMLNKHLYANLLSPAETILKLQEAFEIIQLNLN